MSKWAKGFELFKEKFFFHNHRPATFINPFFISLGLTVILIVGFEIMRYVDMWSHWRGAVGNATHFCELNRFGQNIIQPSNTWSNLGFLIVGLICISVAIRDHMYNQRHTVSNFLARHPGFSFLIGISSVYLFVGSFMYHASLTWLFQKIDQTGMYAVLLSFFAYNIFKMFPTIRKKTGEVVSSHKLIINITILLNLLFFFFLWKIGVMIITPVLIVIIFISNLVAMKRVPALRSYTNNLKLAVASLLIATSIWILDWTNVLCAPQSIFQGHALWHLLTASSILFMYFYFRGEEMPVEVVNRPTKA